MAISLRLAAPPSDQEILELSRRNPGLQFERRAAGDLVVTPTGSESGRREAKLVGQLDRWDTARGGGVVFGPSTGFHLPDGSLLSPDASWLRRERWEALSRDEREGFAPLCPDAVFEVASRSDPKHRAVEVYSPDSAPRILEPAGPVSLDPVLSGFTLDPEPIFS